MFSKEELEALLVWLQEKARSSLRDYPPNFTLNTTALVHEAVIRLMRARPSEATNRRAYLFGAGAQAVREALADAVRKRMRLKNGAKFHRINLLDIPGNQSTVHADFLDLHEAVEALKNRSERLAQVVDLKFYAGWTIKQIAKELKVSDWVVENDWRKAREFLKRYLTRPEGESGDVQFRC